MSSMENFVTDKLHPTEHCLICCSPFSAGHQPVCLPCKHIFGYDCIKKWLTEGRGNRNACPHCRHTVVECIGTAGFDAASIWRTICSQPVEARNEFMSQIWITLRALWKRHPDGKFSTTSLLHNAIMPSLLHSRTTSRDGDPFFDAFTLIYGSWASLSHADFASGLAIPFVRLARLMANASQTLPAWLTNVPRTNALLWNANSSIDISKQCISWDQVMRSAHPVTSDDERIFPVLFLYTVLISQSVAHDTWKVTENLRRHEIMNRVVERCCKKIGGDIFSEKPSNEFKDILVEVYQDLRKFQIGSSKPSLRGHFEEQSIVRGIWALARWSVVKD